VFNNVLEDKAISDNVPMRCVRRQSAYLNKGKSEELDNLINSYAKEKDYHLRSLTPQVFASYPNQISYRDSLLHRLDGYKSPYGLQARMWKMALKDAYETIEKYWTALAEDIRPLISHKQFWSDSMIHYAYWLLFNPRRVASLYAGNTPIPTRFNITPYYRSIVVKIIAKEVRKNAGRAPRVRVARSACFDPNMYTIASSNTGAQQIKLMGLKPRSRILVPLLGQGKIAGNVRIVKEHGDRKIEVHTIFDLVMPDVLPDGDDAGIDIGQSEVITDNQGKRYGKGFGDFLAKVSAVDRDKGVKRGKLHSIRKKAIANGNFAKARRIKVNNLGRKNLDTRRRKHQAECSRQVNTAFNKFLKLRQPKHFAQEKLDFRGKAKSKEMSRRTIQMRNSTINKRSHFKASVVGSHREKVNPAYSSQLCPQCGYVHAKNRNGDKFVCLYCGWVGHSDRVGAYNLRNRMDDSGVPLFMPKGQVLTTLLSRFSLRTSESPDWKPKGECSGVDSRYQVTTVERAVAAEMQVEDNGKTVHTVAVIDHPGQPENETVREISSDTAHNGGKPWRKEWIHDVPSGKHV
jgi:transposase